MYKIFFNNTAVYLTNEMPKKVSFSAGKVLVLVKARKKEILQIIEMLESNHHWEEVWLIHPKVQKLFNRVAANFKKINAAGGLVFNPDGELLMIYRRNRWDLPKGKVDKGETIEEAAIREVSEETGIQQVSIAEPVFLSEQEQNRTWHTYIMNGNRILKTTYWFHMKCADPENLIPQAEEDIEEVKWVKTAELSPFQEKTYASIKHLLTHEV